MRNTSFPGSMRVFRGGMAFLLLFLLIGCNGTNQYGTNQQGQSLGIRSSDSQQRSTVVEDRNGDVIDRGASPLEDRDELMGRNDNPNLIVGGRTQLNKQSDVQNMMMMARRVPGVENARITLNGGNAYVTLDLVPNITAAQARSIERQVIAALRQKVPRYDYHITSNDGYHR